MTRAIHAAVLGLLMCSAGCWEWAPIAALHATRGHPRHTSRVRDVPNGVELTDVRVTTRHVRGVTDDNWLVSLPITPTTEYRRTTLGARIVGVTTGIVFGALAVASIVVGVYIETHGGFFTGLGSCSGGGSGSSVCGP